MSNQDSNPYESSGSPDGGTVAAESIPLSDPISVREKIGYGLGDTASNLYWKLFENFQLFFYTEVFGISSLAAGTMFFVTKLWDAINDPFVGFISDRTKTAWGRFRPYLLWMAIPFAVTGILTFYTPDFSPTGKLIYAYITYTLVFMAYTAINIPYGALMGVISTSSLERTTVSTYRFILAFIGGLVVQLCTLPLVEYFGGGKVMKGGVESVVDPQTGFFWTVVCYACAAVVLFLITFATTKERVQPEQKSKSNTFRQDVTDLMKNRPWIVLLFVGLFQILAGWTRGSATGYYFTYFVEVGDVEFPWMHDVASYFPGFLSFIPGFFIGILENPGSFGNFFAAGTVFSILGMFLTRPLVKIFGNKLLLLLVMVGNAICMAAFVGLAKDQWQMMYLIHVIGAFISGPMPILLWAMYADVADYSEWINKRRATGLIFAAATFSQKMGSALGGAVPGWALAAYSFQAPIDGVQQVQTENTIQGIILMMSLIPAVFLMGAVGALLFYNIDKRLMDQIEIDLQSRKSELKSNPDISG